MSLYEENLSVVESLEPQGVWRIFAGMASVSRPSKHEEKIRKHLRDLFDSFHLSYHEDGVGNLVVDVPASRGKEGVSLIVLQAHVDMVCEKNSDITHDFDAEGIHLVYGDDADTGKKVIRGKGTTLGADNGIGVAMALAVATDPSVVHGPLELLFTVDEEAGMTGAKALTSDSFKGRCLLNLDSEEDDELCIGCAGGCDTNLTFREKLEVVPGEVTAIRVSVSGLRGGHSGCDINEGRGNAIKLLARTLSRADVGDLRLAQITGGSKRNAIPREAMATFAAPVGVLNKFQTAAREVQLEASEESCESKLVIDVVEVESSSCQYAMSVTTTRRILDLLTALPSGVLGMHPQVPGLVETSNNISTVISRVHENQIAVAIGALTRSSSASRKLEALALIATAGRLTGADVKNDNDYPGWAPNADSHILGVCQRVYESEFDEKPHVSSIHAGLECGIIGEQIKGMDMVSFGPTILGAHSPDERVFVDSVGKSYRYLVAILAELAASTM